MVEEIKLRRSLIKGKLREGLDRIARENPQADFSSDTPETLAAERRFDEVAEWYEQGRCDVKELREAFLEWEKAFLEQWKERYLFG